MLAGIGVGLFIDEVGKFITQSNDYFFPPAAPIIYATFLLTLLLYLRVRNEPARTVRHDLYAALDSLPHVLDHDLDARSHAELRDRLSHARIHAQDRKLALLAEALLEVVDSEYVELAQRPRSRWERCADRLRALEARWLSSQRMRFLFGAVLLAIGAGAFADLLLLLWTAILPLDLERAVLHHLGRRRRARRHPALPAVRALPAGRHRRHAARARSGAAGASPRARRHRLRLFRAPALAHHPEAAGLLLRPVRCDRRGGARLRRAARPRALSTPRWLGRSAERPDDARRSGRAA